MDFQTNQPIFLTNFYLIIISEICMIKLTIDWLIPNMIDIYYSKSGVLLSTL